MSKIDDAVRELKNLSEAEQGIIAAAIIDFAQSAREPRLTPEQRAEVRRRLDDPAPRFTTLAEIRARFNLPS